MGHVAKLLSFFLFATTVSTAQVLVLPTEAPEVPQTFKQKLYDAFEGRNFTWTSKEFQLGFGSASVYHVSKPLPIPEELRYKNLLDERTYTVMDFLNKDPGNRLHPGSKLRGKEVLFGLNPGATTGVVTVVLETDAWMLGVKQQSIVKMTDFFGGDILRKGDATNVIQEFSKYLAPINDASTRPGDGGQVVETDASKIDPTAQEAADLDRQAADAAMKAQELEQKAQNSGRSGFGGLLGAKYSIQAKQWRKKESRFREQAQQIRAAAPQSGAQARSESGINVLGCVVTTITPEIAAAKGVPPGRGVLVLEVEHDSWCASMRIHSGDIVLREVFAKDHWITSAEEFREIASGWPHGRDVQLVVVAGEDIERHNALIGSRHFGNAP